MSSSKINAVVNKIKENKNNGNQTCVLPFYKRNGKNKTTKKEGIYSNCMWLYAKKLRKQRLTHQMEKKTPKF